MELVRGHLLLVSDVAASEKILAAGKLEQLFYVQEESFIKLRWPAFVLFCYEFSFLVCQVWSYQVDLNIWLLFVLRFGHIEPFSGNNWGN